MHTAERVKASDVVGEWGDPFPRALCPKNRTDPEPCDCGFVGDWQVRIVFIWYDHPGHKRRDSFVRRDIARGLPPRADEEGWWVLGGWDERCPGCGDIERFDYGRNLVDTKRELGQVVRFLRPGDRAAGRVEVSQTHQTGETK